MANTIVSANNYATKIAKQFCRDMRYEASLDPYHYRGRFFWEGPAVNVDSLQDALSYTKVPCQYDSMGLGYVVYPKESALLLDEQDFTFFDEEELTECEDE